MLPLCPSKLDAETYDVAYQYFGQYGQESIAKHLPETSRGKCTGSQIVLITHIVHAKKQSRHQGYHHNTHDTLGIDGIVNAYTTLGSGIGHQNETLKTIVQTPQGLELASFLEIRPYLIKKTFQIHSSKRFLYVICPILLSQSFAIPIWRNRQILPRQSPLDSPRKYPIAPDGQYLRQ